jgi:hypothetical protein
MAVSNLTQLTQSQYQALTITPFPTPPVVTETGNPDDRVSVNLGGWVGTSVLAFTVENQASASSSLTIQSATGNVLNASVVRSSSPTASISYWTVNMGAGASGTDWEISVNVSDGTVNTGTWVFVKSKSIKDLRRRQTGTKKSAKGSKTTSRSAKAGASAPAKKTTTKAKPVKKGTRTKAAKGAAKAKKATPSRTTKKGTKTTVKKVTRKAVKKGR